MSLFARRGFRKQAARAIALLSAASLLAGFAILSAQQTEPASAADNSNFNPGNIISDAEFYNGASMSVTQIQNFLNTKLPVCEIGRSKTPGTYFWTHIVTGVDGKPKEVIERVADSCLKDYRTDSYTVQANAYCQQYVGQTNESAAQIIAKVSSACGINPKALLVTIQKEMSFVTDSWPTDYMYDYAVGYGCNDSGPGFSARCQEIYKGFFVQIYNAAWQFKHYANPNIGWKFKAATTVNIQFNPDPNCGSSPVYIQGKATAALYNYTPYQPNQLSLQGISGSQNPCGAFGNLNFWRLYTDWFPTPMLSHIDNISAVPGGLNASGWAIDPNVTSESVTIRVEYAGTSATTTATVSRPDVGQVYPNYGNNRGFSTQIPSSATGTQNICIYGTTSANPNVLLGCKVIEMYPPGLPLNAEANRIAGSDRYQTAIEVSKTNWPNGLSGDTVYVAVGTNFPDALSAAAAAANLGGPLLLTPSNEMYSGVRDEIQRLKPTQIVVVGGVNAVSESVYELLSILAPNIRRDYGGERYETSQIIASQAFGTNGTTDLYLATGTNFPDALSASVAAGNKNSPLVLVQGSSVQLDQNTIDAIRKISPQKINIVGGDAAISAGIEEHLKLVFGTNSVTRVSGADRYATSTAINQGIPAPQNAYVATGVNFADALTGAVLAATTSSRLYLSPTSCMPAPVLQEVATLNLSQKTVLLGGTSALASSVQKFARC